MSKPVIFNAVNQDIPIDQLMVMKDYVLAVRFFSDESVPSYCDLLLTSEEFDILQPDFINQVARLKDAGFLDREVQFYISKKHTSPFCVVGPSPSFLARLNYNVFERSQEA